MEKHLSYHFLNESFSLLCILFYTVYSWVLKGQIPCKTTVMVAFAFGCAVKLTLPVSDESARKSIFPAAVLTVLCVLSAILNCNRILVLSLLMLLVFMDSLLRIPDRYMFVRPLLGQTAAWPSVEIHARSIYAMGYLLLCSMIFVCEAYGFPVLKWITLVLILTEYVLLNARAHSGRSFMIGKRKEDKIRNATDAGQETVLDCCESKDDEAKMKVLYEKVVAFMESKLPFLDENFSLNNLAESVYTNKTYLSKTINLFSGKNFCQFVNHYRVMYSLERMHKDPRLKVFELAAMSGFHSVVTFNMAFKLNLSQTPSEYLQKLKMDSILPPSNLMEQEQLS